MRGSKKQKIRVCHVVNALDVGGMENGVVNLCNNLDRSEFEPMICCLYHTGPMADRLRPDVRVINMAQQQGKSILSVFRLARLFKQIKPDIVHTHGWGGGSLYGILGAKLAGVSVIINGEHGTFFLKPHQIVLQRILSVMCDKTLSVSEFLKKKIVESLSIAPGRIRVIPNGVDTDKFTGNHDCSYLRHEILEKYGVYIDEESIVLGCVGSLKPIKNQIMLLRALLEIKNNPVFKKAYLLLVGDGPDYGNLKKFVSQTGLTNKVLFLGKRSDVPQLMSLMHILVSTSHYEGMPNVIMEAFASGLPVVATKAGGSEELIQEGTNGCLVDVDDYHALAEKLILLISNSRLRQKMGLNAQRTARSHYSIAKMVSDYEKFYIDLFNGEDK